MSHFSLKLTALFLMIMAATARAAAPLELVTKLNTPQTRSTAAGISMASQFSADGRYVLFTSSANDLVPAASNGKVHIFIRDLVTGEIRLLSVATDGSVANGDSTAGAISANNRYVVFESAASNLAPGDTNGLRDIFFAGP